MVYRFDHRVMRHCGASLDTSSDALAGVRAGTLRALGTIEALDPPWPYARDGVAYYPDDPAAVQAWFGEVEVLGGEVEIEEVMNALRVIMVSEHSEIDTVG